MTISGQAAAAVHRPSPAPAPISGSTKLVGLIGEDVRYSLSLRLHNHAFAALGLDWAYLPLPVAPSAERLGDALRGLRAMGFAGANITMPHKEVILPLLDEISPIAARIGAVNTVSITPDGAFLGDNTDAEGFISDLRAHGVDPAGQPALLLGAGGAARAVAFGLAESGCYDIAISNRTPWRAERLALDLEAHFPRVRLAIVPWAERADAAGSPGLVVNCTPVGMAGVRTPGGAESPFPGVFSADQVVIDLVYAPLLTPMLAAARRSGAQTLTGLGMLVRQAALSFACWTRHAPPVRHMQDAIQEMMS